MSWVGIRQVTILSSITQPREAPSPIPLPVAVFECQDADSQRTMREVC